MKFFQRRFTRPGAPPGELTTPERFFEPQVELISYDAEVLEVARGAELVRDVRAHIRPGRVAWFDVSGLGDGSIVGEIGEQLGLHHLALSDVVNVGQRPKADDYEDFLFFVVRMVTSGEEGLTWEQVSLFVGEGFVLSFQETSVDCFESLRERLRLGRKQVRCAGADYLAVMVLDAIVDGYFPVLEGLGEELEALEDAILAQATRENLEELYLVRRQLMVFRRAVWPLRDVLSHLVREEHALLSPGAVTYLRDTTDHVMQVTDVVESFRELATTLVEVHLSAMGQRTNEVMRVLTVISTIFIPLTFLVGVYGMNFDTTRPGNMPELGWSFGYVGVWAICLVLAGSLLVVFRRLGWLGGR